MKKLGKGFKQVIIGILGGLILTAIINALAQHDIVPQYSVTIFALVSLVGNIITINSMRRWGIFYTIGWLSGSWIFLNLGLLGMTGVLLNIVLPMVITAGRLTLWLKQKMA